MAFDFKKAINGEPIYLNGKHINVSYNPKSMLWRVNVDEWNKNGLAMLDNYRGDLSTDPPKKKVKVTAFVYRNQYGNLLFFQDKQMIHVGLTYLGEISGEVEI